MVSLEEAAARIEGWCREHEEEMVAFLRDFVAIRSVTYEEGDAVRFLAGRMRDFGFDEVRVDPVGNVLGRVGKGPVVMLYDAHVDTVEPGEPAAWGFDPLQGKMENGIIYGRGVVDDKGALAAMVFAARGLKELGLESDVTMWVSGSVAEEDEEGSCVEESLRLNPDIIPHCVVVAESSELEIMRGQKGRALLKITVPGKAAHASCASAGDNALIKALPVVQGIDAMHHFADDPELGEGTIEVTKLECDTLSLNTIPGQSVIYADRRLTCRESIETLLDEVRPLIASIPGATVEVPETTIKTWTGYEITLRDYFPSWVIPEEHPLVEAGQKAYRALFKRESRVGLWDFSTNATFLCGRRGIPAIGFGAGIEAHCHSEQEQIKVDDYLKAASFYAALAVSFGRSGK